MAQLAEVAASRGISGVIAVPVRRSSRAVPRRLGAGQVSAPVEMSPERLSSLLVAVGKDRDRAAFVTLFEHFAPRLKSFFMRQGTAQELVEEVVQETMVNVWRRADTFDPGKASPSTWIFAIGRNMRIDILRKERRPAPDLSDPALAAEPEPLAHELIARRQDTERLRAAMADLPEDQRLVLAMAFFEDKPHVQIAEALSLPLGTVKSRIRLAMARLRSSIGEF
jgi:RNA polymerase sigma factor (sigma-70 family)